ncbi:uncharacterized protein LOC132624231 [Lycium barbarum]|uniref:uncharacterized protein LOC132624231 n=1 Tax=Lycium barbarum TaxID=112863 RepID=UPI00293F4C6F|nr:uncharacterized protein LOC132624231 [Lycium barbarum]
MSMPGDIDIEEGIRMISQEEDWSVILEECAEAPTAKKILRAGYYWMTMESDCCNYVQRYHSCQIHGDLMKVPPSDVNVISSPWPFISWGMDVIGPIEPTASNGHRFILVAIDYFTKWVEATSHKSVTNKVEIYEKFKITHQNSTAYQPQMNGAVEAANKNIERILRKITDNYSDWHKKLPYSLLGYRTTARIPTGATPYMLVYGAEAVIPAKVEIPSLRIVQAAESDNAEWVRPRYEQLALIDEKMMVVVCHSQLYRQRMARAFHERVRTRLFQIGQMVLKRIFPYQDEYKGKLLPTGKVLM